jgi:parvulin-like peptidyl-prolyl isomerase
MSTLDTPIASLPGASVSLGQLLHRLRRQGRLWPLAVQALSAQVVLQEASQAGLSVSADELQATADTFRRRAGLLSAADTNTWLAREGLSVDDLEVDLEEHLLASKLKQHQAAQADEYFSTHQKDFDRLGLRCVLVEREDLARELASQVRDEGGSLEDVAAAHGLSVARGRLFRKDAPRPVAEALAAAKPGELVGPVATPEGFALVVVEERRPADLDAATRQRIQDELFDGWLAGRMSQATFDLEMAGPST